MAEKNTSPSAVKTAEGHGLRHIAFIMDGNGRWAKKRGLPRSAGHVAGAKKFREIINYCGDIGIECVTVYAFSTENWSRPEDEVRSIMKLFRDYLRECESTADKYDIRMRFLGDISCLGEELERRANALVERTKNNRLQLNIALNYGGRAEIVRAFNRLAEEGKTNITEADISGALYTAGLPDPDLIVRTGGEMRLSNFLLWQSAYAEYYATDVLWPDMTPRDVDLAVEEFNKRKRRFGGV